MATAAAIADVVVRAERSLRLVPPVSPRRFSAREYIRHAEDALVVAEATAVFEMLGIRTWGMLDQTLLSRFVAELAEATGLPVWERVQAEAVDVGELSPDAPEQATPSVDEGLAVARSWSGNEIEIGELGAPEVAVDAVHAVRRRLRLFVLRHGHHVAFDEYRRGTRSLSSIASEAGLDICDVVSVAEELGVARDVDVIRLSADARAEMNRAIEAARRQRLVFGESSNRDLGRRDAIASQRLEGVDARKLLGHR